MFMHLMKNALPVHLLTFELDVNAFRISAMTTKPHGTSKSSNLLTIIIGTYLLHLSILYI